MIPDHVRLPIEEIERLLRAAKPKSKRGLAALLGQWPGTETDAEVFAALKVLK